MNDDDLIIKALKPGKAKISVKILEPSYEHLQATVFELKVVEFFKIEPKENIEVDDILNILPVTRLPLKAMKMLKDDNQIDYLDAPSSNYLWSSNQFGTIDQSAVLLSND
jgi:hypothetical protein